jgi:sugar/nucleoside kinase (ribokinase family)
MLAMWDVLGFGALAVDDLVYLAAHPSPNSKSPILDERRDGGGLAGTALAAAARLGARAAYGGVLGDDELSQAALDALQRDGVDCSSIKRQPGARPIHSVILVDQSSGDRVVLHNSAGVVPPRIEDFAAVVPQCRVLFVDSTIVAFANAAIPIAQRNGIPVVADLERLPTPEALAMGSRVDHLIVGSVYAERATGRSDPQDMVRSLWSAEHTACVVTVGEVGCFYMTRQTGDRVLHYPAFAVQAVDTTGCGDVFHGAYAATIACGQTIERALAVASATAALKATKPGGRAGIPSWTAVERLLATSPQKH